MINFDWLPVAQHVRQLLRHDETELALKVLDMMPAYYRDHKIKELEDLRTKILSRILMPIELCHDSREMPKSIEHSVNFLHSTARGCLLKDHLLKASDAGITPNIVEYGGGDFTFAIALHHLGFKFNYRNFGFNKNAETEIEKVFGDRYTIEPDQETWFIAYEIIEHLADISEIRQLHDRLPKSPKKIFLSTPKYTFGEGTDWENDGIHHRRAYTPAEFFAAAHELFPKKKWLLIDDPVMCLLSEGEE